MKIKNWGAWAAISVLGWSVTSLSALAADPAAAEARALKHIANFSNRTLHGPDHTYTVRDVIVDPNGAEHVRFDRRYKGLDVVGGDLVVHSGAHGNFISASHTLTRWLDLPVKPSVKAAQAIANALAAHPGHTNSTPAKLVVYARQDLPTLAWDVSVVGELADGTPSEKHVIVDAVAGRLLDAWDDIHTAAANGTGKSLYSGDVALVTNSLSTGYELKDPNRGGQYTVNLGGKTAGSGAIFKDADNIWGNNQTSDLASAAVDAQYGTAVTWDYFKNIHGRSGIANDSKGAYNRVHYGRKYANAFWSDSCFCMTYGDGDGDSLKALVSLDVAGHEMSHGVTSRTANLIYSGESGGLNEATSDIFGSMVEFYAANATDPGDYLIGEKIMVAANKALRYMHQPSKDGQSADCWYSGVGTLNVHYSSGVANHFYYLLAEGSTPTNGLPVSPVCAAADTRTATVTGNLAGLGRDKAEKIWYRALTVYMTSNTNYAGARAATLSAASELYGAGSSEYNAVATAWSAVNVN